MLLVRCINLLSRTYSESTPLGVPAAARGVDGRPLHLSRPHDLGPLGVVQPRHDVKGLWCDDIEQRNVFSELNHEDSVVCYSVAVSVEAHVTCYA